MESDNSFFQELILTALGPFLGALLGFLFAMVLHGIQKDKESDERKRRIQSKRFFLLRLTYAKIWWNIQKLLVLKKQLVLPLKEDLANFERAKSEQPGPPIDTHYKLPSFFKWFEEIPHEMAEELTRIEFVAPQDLNFSKTSFHVIDSLKSFDDFIVQRNLMLVKYADATDRGATLMQLNYCLPMLTSQSNAIAAKLDESLFFLRCAAKQIENYADENFKSEKFLRGKFVQKDMETLMPPEDWIPGYAEAAGVNPEA